MLYWLGFIVLEVIRNLILIDYKKIRPNYPGAAVFRSFFGLVCAIIMCPEWDPLGGNFTVILPYIGFELATFDLIFDPALNLVRNKPIFYKGKNSGIMDKLPNWAYFAINGLSLAYLIVYFMFLR